MTPIRTSLPTELVPFSMSPLARRKPAPPRRKPPNNKSITSSREVWPRPPCLGAAGGKERQKERFIIHRSTHICANVHTLSRISLVSCTKNMLQKVFYRGFSQKENFIRDLSLLLMSDCPNIAQTVLHSMSLCVNYVKWNVMGIFLLIILDWFNLANNNGTCGLSGLHSSSQQSSQQSRDSHSHIVVGTFKGSEAQSSHILQLTGPQERGLPLQLQQTLPGSYRNRIINYSLHILIKSKCWGESWWGVNASKS